MMKSFVLTAVVVLVCGSLGYAADQKVSIGVQVLNEEGKVKVESVEPKSPAAAAGIKQGDVIEKIGDFVLQDTRGFEKELQKRKPGDKVDLVLSRDGTIRKVTVILGKKS